jgi:putative N6-adenine-specific DNA methylase
MTMTMMTVPRRPIMEVLFSCAVIVGLLVSPLSAFLPLQQQRLRASVSVSPLQARSGAMDESSHYNSYLATCIPGLSNVLAGELRELGAVDIETSGNAAVTFRGPSKTGLTALLWLRTVHRLMELVATDRNLETRQDLHEFVANEVNVQNLLGNGKGGLLTLSVHSILNQPSLLPKDLTHSHYTSLTIKNALCDSIRSMRGDRPDVELDDPDVPLVCILRGMPDSTAEVSLYRQLHSPGSLHKRGYRSNAAIHKAAMKESLAAGLLLGAGWADVVKELKNNPTPTTVMDPMAGSGSLILEAAMMAADIAPGLMRIKCEGPQAPPPMLRWKSSAGLDDVWRELLMESTQRAKTGLQWAKNAPLTLLANDVHGGALDICEASLQQAGLLHLVKMSQGDCVSMEVSPGSKTLVYTNPPWGVRLDTDMEASWESLRHLLRNVCPPNTEAWVLSGNKAATKHLGLKRSNSLQVKTAEQDLRWIQYLILDEEGVAKLKEASGNYKEYNDDDGYVKPEPQQPRQAKSTNSWGDFDRRQERSYDSYDRRPSSAGYDGRAPSSGRGGRGRGGGGGGRGYERRGRPERPNGQQTDRMSRPSDVTPLTNKEREDKKSSWYI